MEQVSCKLNIHLTNKKYSFGEGWDFELGIYTFLKTSEDKVDVRFQFKDEVRRKEPDGTEVVGLSSYSPAFIEVYENLETLLDILTLEMSGIGIEIDEESILLSSTQITQNPLNNHRQINLEHKESINDRFTRTISAKQNKLLDALRLHRLASNESNTGERIGQLWGIVEGLYGESSTKILNSKEKKKEISGLIDQATLIDEEEKLRLKEMLKFVDAKSLPKIIAEKLSLGGADGKEHTIQEVQNIVAGWRSARSPQAHGTILVRDDYVNFLASEMEHIMETAIGAEINPSRYFFIVFRNNNVAEDFSTHVAAHQDPDGSGYYSRSIYKFASMNMADIVRHNLKNSDSQAYLVDYSKIQLVTSTEVSPVDLSSLDAPVRNFILNRQAFLNHQSRPA